MDINDKVITIPVTLEGTNRKKDRSITLRFQSLFEVSNEDFSVMDQFHQEAGHLLFKKNAFSQEDIPTEDVETDVAKSQSVQLRDALWVLYKQRGNPTTDKQRWNEFYRKQMQVFKARVLQEVHDLEDGGGRER